MITLTIIYNPVPAAAVGADAAPLARVFATVPASTAAPAATAPAIDTAADVARFPAVAPAPASAPAAANGANTAVGVFDVPIVAPGAAIVAKLAAAAAAATLPLVLTSVSTALRACISVRFGSLLLPESPEHVPLMLAASLPAAAHSHSLQHVCEKKEGLHSLLTLIATGSQSRNLQHWTTCVCTDYIQITHTEASRGVSTLVGRWVR